MVLGDLKNRIAELFGRKESGDVTRRPDGGTSCYKPTRRRTEPAEQAPGPEYTRPVAYAHTGFTGMNPPAYGPETGYTGPQAYGAPGAYAPEGGYTGPQAWGAPGSAPQQAGYAPQQTGYAPQQTGYAQTAYSGRMSYSQQHGMPGIQADPEVRKAARPERGWFPPREEPKQGGNISYMPGYAPDGSTPWNHTEHIMTMTGLRSCYEAIECMRNGETLIVMMDAIANESESMRCQDMLAGAAFTLGCGVRMLQGGKVVLIAPETVRILPEQAPARPEMKPAYAPPPAPRSAEPAPARRERRSGARAEEWNAARNGQMDNYNPYTGTMPVAAGSYGAFGGYGY